MPLIETPFHLAQHELLISAISTIIIQRLYDRGASEYSLEQVMHSPQYGFTASASMDPTGTRFVRISDLRGANINWNTVPYCECEEPDKYKLDKSDILIARAGSVGRSFIVDDVPELAVFASYLIRLRTRIGFSSGYIYWCLQSQQFWRQLLGMSRGSAMQNVNANMLKRLVFPVPTRALQEQIDVFLRYTHQKFQGEDIDLPNLPEPLSDMPQIVAHIDALTARISEARGLRQAALEEAEALQDSFISRRFDYEFGDRLPNGWRWLTFEETLSDCGEGIKTGPFGTLLSKSDLQESGVPILGIANVQANELAPGFKDFLSLEKAMELSPYELHEGDIVIARSGTVGRSCVVPHGLRPVPIMSTNLMRVRLNHKVLLPELLSRLFNGSHLIERYKERELRGTTHSFFTQKILLRLMIPTPPIAEQIQIISEMQQVQSKHSLLRSIQVQTQTELDALLPSVLDQAFRGELI